jgi:hydrogenase maturation protease
MKTLVIGYGNRSRRDDGVGWVVVERLRQLGLPADVAFLTVHQLEVEMAETLTGYEAVVFVDAAIPESPQAIQRAIVGPQLQSHPVAHFLTPSDVLSLCQTLYGHMPHAVLFSIRGRDFNFGEELSPEVERAAGEVVNQIEQLVRGNGVLAATGPNH